MGKPISDENGQIQRVLCAFRGKILQNDSNWHKKKREDCLSGKNECVQ